MSITSIIQEQARTAKNASRQLAVFSAEKRQAILHGMADELAAHISALKNENDKDLLQAKADGLSSALVDRLTLTDERISSMIHGIREVASLPDPLGEVLERRTLKSGLKLEKLRVPIGVIGIIFESRPNVTADAAALCLMSGNSVILRGGKEAINSNKAIASLLIAGAERSGLPVGALQFVDVLDRDAVRVLVEQDEYLDLIIPRGGEGLIRAVTKMSRVPVIKHYKGLCHIYVDQSANTESALRIVENAKCQRPGVCNAVETLLVSREIASSFIPDCGSLLEKRGVELRGDKEACEILSSIKPASADDWDTEYLDLILSIKVVADVGEAISHIATHGSGHSEAIVADDDTVCDLFCQAVDAAAVYVNSSTRFTDGEQFGLGAEIGISTDKLHARGPMGLRELTSYKYVLRGDGQVRS